MRTVSFTAAKHDSFQSCLSGYSDEPNYMSDTKSSRAKFKSLNAPGERRRSKYSNVQQNDDQHREVIGEPKKGSYGGTQMSPKSDSSQRCLSGCSDHPNYMTHTQSSQANVRSLSAPGGRRRSKYSNVHQNDDQHHEVVGNRRRLVSKEQCLVKWLWCLSFLKKLIKGRVQAQYKRLNGVVYVSPHNSPLTMVTSIPALQTRARLGLKKRHFPVDKVHLCNSSIGLNGQYVRRDHGSNPFILLESVVSQDLWIWHAFFGVAWLNNDINVLYQSSLFTDLKTDRAPEISFVANGVSYPSGYYLVDGIYPELALPVKTIPEPADDDHKQILYKQKWKSTKKDVERAFGVLKKK
nr:putative nuclease HARBI1 [Tanacetum cinerariifolium]